MKKNKEKSPFDISGTSKFGKELQIHADRNHAVSKFGQYIVVGSGSTRTWGPLDRKGFRKTK